jgi:hypothetical protein
MIHICQKQSPDIFFTTGIHIKRSSFRKTCSTGADWKGRLPRMQKICEELALNYILCPTWGHAMLYLVLSLEIKDSQPHSIKSWLEGKVLEKDMCIFYAVWLSLLCHPHPFIFHRCEDREVQLPVLVRYKKRKRGTIAFHIFGAYYTSSQEICEPHQVQKRVFLFFFLYVVFSWEKKRKREQRLLLLTPAVRWKTELLSILGLWICDSCALPSVWVVISLKDI